MKRYRLTKKAQTERGILRWQATDDIEARWRSDSAAIRLAYDRARVVTCAADLETLRVKAEADLAEAERRRDHELAEAAYSVVPRRTGSNDQRR